MDLPTSAFQISLRSDFECLYECYNLKLMRIFASAVLVVCGLVLGLSPVSTGAVTFTTNVTAGSASILGTLSKGSGSFVIDHPLDPRNKLLYHSFVESPDVKNIYDGVVTLDEKGEAIIELPDYFLALNKDFRYLGTAIKEPMPNLYLSKGVGKKWF